MTDTFELDARGAFVVGKAQTTPEDEWESFPRIVSRRRIGAILTAGQKDYLRLERGIQTYLGYS